MRARVVLTVFAVLVLIASAGVYLAIQGLGHKLPLRIATQECTVKADGTVVLDPEQMANAATIAAVGITRGLPARAIIIALAAAQQESKLHNLKGGDRDSVGLFQQRPSQGWGTPEQISDPRYAAGKFYSALLKVKGWQHMSVTQAAQKVQRSAYGAAYQKWADRAKILATALLGDAGGAVACTITDRPALRGAEAAEALIHGVSLDWGDVEAVPRAGLPGVELTVRGTRSGWQFAHWLVAHSDDQAVKSVRFGGQVWTAKDGAWTTQPASGGTGAAGLVIAEVYS